MVLEDLQDELQMLPPDILSSLNQPLVIDFMGYYKRTNPEAWLTLSSPGRRKRTAPPECAPAANPVVGGAPLRTRSAAETAINC